MEGLSMADALANDRTFLAWLRTGIALFGLGFVVAKVSLLLDADEVGFSEAALYSTIGVLVVLCGALVIGVGYRQHVVFARELDRAGVATPTGRRWPGAFALVAAVGAVVLSALILVTT
jgi:putative membrane protein